MEIFRNNESTYLRWIAENPEGYVLNTSKAVNKNYLSLHIAKCGHIATYGKNQAKDAFTGKSYIKICATNIDELYAWIASIGASEFTQVCRDCKPNITNRPTPDVSGEYEGATESKKPRAFLVQVLTYSRKPVVVTNVLTRAQGVCERCRKPAPFVSASTGEPFLEVHHTIPLSAGGEDTEENAEALCPNCHRQAHYG